MDIAHRAVQLHALHAMVALALATGQRITRPIPRPTIRLAVVEVEGAALAIPV